MTVFADVIVCDVSGSALDVFVSFGGPGRLLWRGGVGWHQGQ